MSPNVCVVVAADTFGRIDGMPLPGSRFGWIRMGRGAIAPVGEYLANQPGSAAARATAGRTRGRPASGFLVAPGRRLEAVQLDPDIAPGVERQAGLVA